MLLLWTMFAANAGSEWALPDLTSVCVLYIVRIRLKMDITGWPRLDSWTRSSVERPAALIARTLRESLCEYSR